MARVVWKSLARRTQMDFAHTTNGRLHADQLVRPTCGGWAVCGGEAFLRKTVPALRSAGVSVMALSVMPSSFHNVSARLRAQDAQDRLCHDLNVSTGLSVEAIDAADDFGHVLIEEAAGVGREKAVRPPLRLLDALENSGKTLVRAASDRADVHSLHQLVMGDGEAVEGASAVL